jgi:RNA polymerase sigma-70 factor, ECF subfamily
MKPRAPRDRVTVAEESILVQAAAEGNQRAFRSLYRSHHRRVRRFLTKLVGTGPDREDLLQEVFFQLHRALPNFRGDSALSTFIRRITWNVACDHLRKRWRDRLDYESKALDQAVDCAQNPEDHSSARQQLRSLWVHLEDLTVNQSTALRLVAIEGLSLHAAADRTGASSASIKQHVARARRDLAALIERERVGRGGNETRAAQRGSLALAARD